MTTSAEDHASGVPARRTGQHVHGNRRCPRKPIKIRQRGRPAAAADARQRDSLLDRDAHVRAARHEREMVERGRDHRVFERRCDDRPRLAAARASARGLYLIPPRARHTNDVGEAEWRREHGCRLRCSLGRPDSRADGEKKSESESGGSCHGDPQELTTDSYRAGGLPPART
jgi:hypothetical protein